jgi:hypothetical protein
MTIIISLAGLVIVFFLAYGFDRLIMTLQQAASAAFALSSYLWLSSIANLILAGALLLLAWFVYFRAAKSKLISVIFMVLGLLVTFASALIYTFFSTLPPLGIAEFLTPYSRVVVVAGLIAVIGIAGLLPRKSRDI